MYIYNPFLRKKKYEENKYNIPLTTCSWWPSFPLKIGRDHGLETGKPLSTLVYGAEGTTTRTTSADGSRPLTERDSDSLEPGGGCVDRSGTTSLRPSDTQVTVNFSPFLLSPCLSFSFSFIGCCASSCFLPSFPFFSFKPFQIVISMHRLSYIGLIKSVQRSRSFQSLESLRRFQRNEDGFFFIDVMLFFSFDSFSYLYLLVSRISSKRDGNLIGIKFDLDGVFLRDWTIWRYKCFEAWFR